jgi:uncharacterized protein
MAGGLARARLRCLSGETDIAVMLAGLLPHLFDTPCVFETIAHGAALPPDTFATIAEDEALTVVRPAGHGDWARISLALNSSLSAVGLTAAMISTLARNDISANIIAGAYHDHLFVACDARHDAMQALSGLALR